MNARKDVLIIPGLKRDHELLFFEATDHLRGLHDDYRSSACGPFKMLRLDRYFLELDKVVAVCMRPAKGGNRWDNRRCLTKKQAS
jgi:hypothetical protein